MDKDEKTGTCIILAVLTIVAFCFYLSWRQSDVLDNFKAELVGLGLEVENGEVESPSLILSLDKEEFLAKTLELNTTIYQQSFTFYVFEPDMQIAYRYNMEMCRP